MADPIIHIADDGTITVDPVATVTEIPGGFRITHPDGFVAEGPMHCELDGRDIGLEDHLRRLVTA